MEQERVRRYQQLIDATRRTNLDAQYHAAFYLLSHDPEVYEAARRCVGSEGIEFSKLKSSLSGFDERTRRVVDIAHNLFSANSKCAVSPHEMSTLGYPLLEEVCRAMYIANEQLEVRITGREGISLDDTRYRQTQAIHRQLDRMSVAARLENARGERGEPRPVPAAPSRTANMTR